MREREREGRADFIMKAELAAVSDTHVGDDRAATVRRRGKGTDGLEDSNFHIRPSDLWCGTGKVYMGWDSGKGLGKFK